ncbi:MAG TPA: preprotein translocase subunit SecG [Syntrophomonadaceae bacterium]|nr:preprotein translocase subunit SecG [Syntrophomonadaceae bacterium]
MLKIILIVIQVLAALALISTVLLQSGKSAGLSGSISGGSEAIFGGKKKGIDDLLNKLTAYIAALFLILTLILSFVK